MKIPDWLPDTHHPAPPDDSPRQVPIEMWLRPVVHFMHIEAAGGIVLLVCTLLAFAAANSPWAEQFNAIWQTRIGFTIGSFQLYKPLLLWINDGLMTIFFFVVGLEIKREIVFGELGELRKAMLPAAAALGGMLAPAGIYLLVQGGAGPGGRGWGIPMATDIAFVVGFLALLGSRVSLGLKILLLTLAIVDDIGAILVIAIAYSTETSTTYLALGLGGLVAVGICRWIGVRRIPVYIVIGAAIWLAVLKSGVHPTIAGVVLGLLTPAVPWFAERSLIRVAEGVAHRLRQDHEANSFDHHEEAVQVLTATAIESVSPLDRLETALHPWVAFAIMPLFALANAGVRVEPAAILEPVAMAVAAGLIVGKPLGILVFSWIAVRLGLARLPGGVDWRVLFGAGCLAGIGFTMSLFIAGLALEGPLLTAGKIGTLLGSTVSAVVGLSVLAWLLKRPSPAADV
jgi:NhaA family Na+:H+ antiporter